MTEARMPKRTSFTIGLAEWIFPQAICISLEQ